ncbi:hypothetical protein ACFVJ8_12845 [Streptomyces yangpuensis]
MITRLGAPWKCFDRDGHADLAAVGADGKAVWFRATATGIDTTPRPVG